MLISETLEERLIRQIEKQGNKVDTIERILYLKEGTTPSSAMRALKMMGYRGQNEKNIQAEVIVVNAYTQYGFSKINHKEGTEPLIDYVSLRLVMQKINHIFK